VDSDQPELGNRAPHKQPSTQTLLRAGVGLVLLGMLSLAVLEYSERKAHEFDQPLVEALEKVTTTHSYAQFVDTSTIVSDRPLRVYGWYLVDHDQRSYAAFSTTTLNVPEGTLGSGSHDFSHDNIAMQDTVYVKVDTASDFLSSSINKSDAWKRFEKDAIPEEYRNIAIVGPILDNLRIFANNAEHLELVRKYGLETIDDRTLRHYRFKLKSSVPSESTVGALAERLGDSGTIDIWIDDTEKAIVRMLFKHDFYTSTTTLSSFNTLPRITPPSTFEE
jgi:hypothetical protein